MTEEMTIEQQNEMIAVFDGGTKNHWRDTFDTGKIRFPVPKSIRNGVKQYSFDPFDLKYHLSWDWLMPVWFKFRDLTFSDRKKEIPHSRHCQSVSRAICYENIYNAHGRISDAIKWYNENKQP